MELKLAPVGEKIEARARAEHHARLLRDDELTRAAFDNEGLPARR
jgi:hypothetical protein